MTFEPDPIMVLQREIERNIEFKRNIGKKRNYYYKESREFDYLYPSSDEDFINEYVQSVKPSYD